MARPLRINVKNGWYHIWARGIERRTIFEDRRDHEHFLELLSRLPERYGLLIHAYALVGNHYHLLIQAPNANTSAAIQWLNVSYSAWFNRRRERVGHVFQGRFGSTLVDGDGTWALNASVYVHLNPIRIARIGLDKSSSRAEASGAKVVDPETAKERLKRLRAYGWSSYGAYAGYRARPDWLTIEELCQRAGGRAAYRKLVQSHVARGTLPEEYEVEHAHPALGSQRFWEALKKGGRVFSREQPARHELIHCVPVDAVVAVVERMKGEKWSSFSNRHGDDGRELVLYLARRRTGRTLREIGASLGIEDYKTVAKAVERFEKSLKKNAARRRCVYDALIQLSNVET